MKRAVDQMLGTTFFDDPLPIYVNRVAENFDLSEHTHDFVELTYIGEGTGVHYIDGKNIRVLQGDVFCIPVGVPHVFRPAAPGRERALIVYNCLIRTDYLLRLETFFPDAAKSLSIFREPTTSWIHVRDSGEFREWFKTLYREYATRRTGYEAVMTALVVQMLIALHRQLPTDAPTTSSIETPSSAPSIEQTVRKIEERYAEHLTVKELAMQIGLSERQFSRVFAQQTGMNFSTFVQNTRIEAACDLLTTSRRSVPEIAAAVGYNDLKFFYQLFKRKTGLTPLQHRKRSVDQFKQSKD